MLLGMFTYTFEMNTNFRIARSVHVSCQLVSKPGKAIKFCVDELQADPHRRLIWNQTNLFAAAKRGDVDKVKAGIVSFF